MSQTAASPGSSGPSAGSAPAARGAPGAPSSPRTQGGNPAAEGGDFDFRGAHERTSRELESTRGELEKLRGKADADGKVLERLRSAFDPESTKGPSQKEQLESEMDEVINAAYAADKAGKSIPLTTKAYLHALQNRIDLLNFMEEMRGTTKDIGAKAEAANDPQTTVNRGAYARLDASIQRGLDQLYGMDDSSAPTKSHLFKAVTGQVIDYIKKLQKAKPEVWDRIRRDPGELDRMALHYLKQTLPPQAVRMMEQQNLQNTPMTEGELMRAFQEAEEIQDPKQRRSVRDRIRGEILELRYGSKSKRTAG